MSTESRDKSRTDLRGHLIAPRASRADKASLVAAVGGMLARATGAPPGQEPVWRVKGRRLHSARKHVRNTPPRALRKARRKQSRKG